MTQSASLKHRHGNAYLYSTFKIKNIATQILTHAIHLSIYTIKNELNENVFHLNRVYHTSHAGPTCKNQRSWEGGQTYQN